MDAVACYESGATTEKRMTELTDSQRRVLAKALLEADFNDGNADGRATRANLLETFGNLQETSKEVRVREIAQLVTNMVGDKGKPIFSGLDANEISVAVTPRGMLGTFARVLGVDVKLYVPPTASYTRS